jgi:dienelactone hydrolase
MCGIRIFVTWLCLGTILVIGCSYETAQTWDNAPEVLPGTQSLTTDDSLDVVLMNGTHRYIERKIDESPQQRSKYWQRDLSSSTAYEKSVEQNRERFRKIIGVVGRGREVNHNIGLPTPVTSVQMERIGFGGHPPVVYETDQYTVSRVRWPVLHGVTGEGLLLEPTGEPVGHVVAIPDADHTPEMIAGLQAGIPEASQFARQLAANGFRVVVPVLISRDSLYSGKNRQTQREWIYRQAFHMGRHIIGYEVQKVMAAVDWLEDTAKPGASLGAAGYGEGGLIAQYTAAVDTRIDAALVSGYFQSRQNIWQEPIYRNVWGLLREFGDAEIATLIAPRGLVIEYSEVPAVSNQKGALHTPSIEEVRGEIQRIDTLLKPGFQPKQLIHGPDGAPVEIGSQDALQVFAGQLGVNAKIKTDERAGNQVAIKDAEIAARQARQVRELDDHVQQLVGDSHHIRDADFLHQVMPEFAGGKWSTKRRHPTHDAQKFIDGARDYREAFHQDVLGKLDEPLLPPSPRTRKIYDEATWVGYEVTLEVLPDVIAWGWLLIPKDLQPGERRPVVVCQHGRNGVPYSLVDPENTAYNQAAVKLAERGFITFIPHNLYRGEDRYRWLDRKANSVKASMFSFIVAQHDQHVRWLSSLPFVDAERIAFYGLSYGGETAVRIPSLLEGYCLSICSGDFNDWTRKVADTHSPYSFMNTIEWEMPYFNMGRNFSYAELAYLIFPRPFMVERGHHDRVAPDSWVASEYAKVRWLYAQFDMADRTEIEFFQGGHSMNSEGTFDFLHKHLGWPRR